MERLCENKNQLSECYMYKILPKSLLNGRKGGKSIVQR